MTGIQPQKNGFIVATKNFTLWAENVLLATGGVSYPKTGSVGDGQNFAKALGHRIVPYQPGLIGTTFSKAEAGCLQMGHLKSAGSSAPS